MPDNLHNLSWGLIHSLQMTSNETCNFSLRTCASPPRPATLVLSMEFLPCYVSMSYELFGVRGYRD
eukprot:605349-Pelagomonas_calceolata.AAC.2